METPINGKRSILHICTHETIRPLRDQVLTLSGFHVDSTTNHTEALSMFWARQYDLVLIDVEGESESHTPNIYAQRSKPPNLSNSSPSSATGASSS